MGDKKNDKKESENHDNKRDDYSDSEKKSREKETTNEDSPNSNVNDKSGADNSKINEDATESGAANGDSLNSDNVNDGSINAIDVTERKKSIIKWGEVATFFKDAKNFLFEEKIEDSGYKLQVEGKLKKQIAPSIKFASIIVVIFILIFCIWGAMAPLDSATVASGSIIPSTKRKMVQIPEGGLNSVKAVHVKDGDLVTKGQLLIELDSTAIIPAVNASRSNARTRLGTEKRILALQSDKSKVDYRDANYKLLDDLNDPEVKFVISTQDELFHSQKESFEIAMQKYNDAIDANKELSDRLQKQLEYSENQLKLEREHLDKMQDMLQKGLVRQSDVVHYSRNYQALINDNTHIRNSLVQEKMRLLDAKMAKENYRNQYIANLSSEYRENHERLVEAHARYLQQSSQLEKTKIYAPETGYIMNLQIHNMGAVFQPTAPVAEILPLYDEMIAEVYVMTKDIHNVRTGMKVKVQLLPYKQRLVPRLDGEVIYVAADKASPTIERGNFPGERRTPMPEVFVVRIKIDTKILSKLSSEVKLLPGMPVAAFIIHGQTTPLRYLIGPIRDSLYRTFIEQ